MVAIQRRQGQNVEIWLTAETADNRGNVQEHADPSTAFSTRVSMIPQRSARAEVPGQQVIEVYRMTVGTDVPGADQIDIWSRVVWRGVYYDCVTPPEFHSGSRQSRHYSIDIRRRPTNG